MCGIIAYKGEENAVKVVMDGLKHLEYRGYDSCGICLSLKDKVTLIKKVGKIENLEKEILEKQKKEDLRSDVGIGHCLHPNTLIQLSNGKVVYIKEINNKDSVINLNPNKLLLEEGEVKIFKIKSPKYLYHIKTPLTDFITTSDHKNLVWQKNKIIEKLTKDLKKKDYLIFPNQIKIKKSKSLKFDSFFYKRYYALTPYGHSFLKSQIKKIGVNSIIKKIPLSRSYLDHIIKNDRNFREDQLKLLYEFLGKDIKKLLKNNKFPHLKPVNTIHGKFIKLPTLSNQKLMQIFGYFIGDGYAGEKSVRFKDTDISNLKTYKKLIEEQFNIKGRIVPQKATKALLLEFNSTYLSNWLKENIKKDKHHFLLEAGKLPLAQLRTFIKGLFDAEGYVNLISKQLVIAMNDEFLIRSLQLWLLRFGIISSFRIEKINKKQKRPNFAYKLSISNRESIKNFKEEISFSAKNKKIKLLHLLKFLGNKHFSFKICNLSKSIILIRVSEIKKIISDTAFVYDLEVNNNHNFLANGILTHNSRWATHGKVSEINAHPHFSCDKEIYVVHNGIIENYEEIKKSLLKKGHKFVSETDTEVIPHLIEEYRKKLPFEKACQKAFKELKGLFACVVLDNKTKEIIGARNGSPLVMGVSKDGLFLASDIPAFLDKTNKVILINDLEMVHLKNEKDYTIKNYLSNKIIKRKPVTINWTKEEAEKGKYPHFMIKEISEIPEAIKKSLIQNPSKIKKIINLIKKAKRVIFVGCGTAGHACLVGKYLFSKYLKKPVDFISASEFPHFVSTITKNDLVIAISQSGETIDVIEAIKKVKERKIKVLSLVNVMGSTLTRISDEVLMINAGPEKCVLATKSYLSQLSLILLLTFSSLNQKQKIDKELKKLSEEIKKLLNNKKFIGQIKNLANLLKDSSHLYIIGRGLQYPTALETALKVKEGDYLHGEAFAGGELKHGVIALVEKNTPCFIHFSKDEEETNTLINSMELKSRGAYLIGFGYKKQKDFNKSIVLPEVEEYLAPLLNIIPIYLLTYYLALIKGLDPDKPRNLAKSVTVK